MGVKILSLYDGMACGMIAMQLAGIEVESYDAYEIDKYAIKTAQHNFPMIKEHGDVFDADFTQYEGVDFLIGGSPCTYWSIAQTKNRETVASGMGWELFSQYVRALHEAKPKYFIYENNKSMSKQIRASIDKAFGFEAVLINSALVSAQNRQRLYWVGRRNEDGSYSRVNVEQPTDRGILLKDVLDNAFAMREKAHAVIASAGRTTEREFFMKNQGNMVAEPVRGMGNDTKSRTLTANYWKTNVRDAFVDCAGGRTMAAEPIEYIDYAPRKNSHIVVNENAIRCAQDKNNASCAESFVEFVDKKSQTLISARVNKIICEVKFSEDCEPVNVTADGKAQCLRATCYKDGIRNIIANEVDKKTGVAEPINDILQVGAMPRPDGEISTSAGFRIYSTEAKGRYLCANGGGAGAKTELYAEPVQYEELAEEYYKGCVDGNLVGMIENVSVCRNGKQPSQQYRVYSCEAKSVRVDADQRKHYLIPYDIEYGENGKPIKAIGKDGKEITIYEVRDGKITIKGKQYPIKLKDGYYIIRKLTVSECKRLQTVPEWYEFPVSNSQAYKMLGNGWTCEVIAHLIRSCMAEQWGGVDG